MQSEAQSMAKAAAQDLAELQSQMRSMSGDVSSLVASMDTQTMQLSEMQAMLEGIKEQREQSASGSHTDVISEEALSLLEGKLVSQMAQLGEAIQEVSVTVKGLHKAIEKGKTVNVVEVQELKDGKVRYRVEEQNKVGGGWGWRRAGGRTRGRDRGGGTRERELPAVRHDVKGKNKR